MAIPERLGLAIFLIVSLVAPPSFGATDAGVGPTREIFRLGQVGRIDLGERNLVIDGYRYFVRPDADIEVAGTFGALELLTVGMKVEIAFLRYSDTRREIVGMRQLPDSTPILRR